MNAYGRRGAFLVVAALLCSPALDVLSEPNGGSTSTWSTPVNMGMPINTTMNDVGAVLSRNGLSLYMHTNRDGGLGMNDLWVAQRDCKTCPWKPPVNLGPVINTPENDGGANFTPDGKTMFFNSRRPGGFGGNDLYVTHREDPCDDFGWGPPVNLGSDVNTAEDEERVSYSPKEDAIYFARGANNQNRANIWIAPITKDGVTLGFATEVTELNHPTVNDGGATVRRDGKEIIFWSNRATPQGDLFVSTRQHRKDPWSTPQIIPELNSPASEIAATLSWDARTVIITSNRTGSLGAMDFWMSTRSKGDDEDDDDDDDQQCAAR